MSQPSRRTFLLGAGAGVAAGVGANFVAAPAFAAPPRNDRSGEADADGGAPLVAYVRDLASGEISLMAGDREVVVTDKALAARLARKLG